MTSPVGPDGRPGRPGLWNRGPVWPGRRKFRLLGLVIAVGVAVVVAGIGDLPAAAKVARAESTKLHTVGSQIVDGHDKPFEIKAVNWFGMETPNCAPHGLWQISLDSGMAQIAKFGFNAIRLPYSNQCIEQSTQVSGVDANTNPGLQNMTPLQVMDAVISSAARHGLRIILDRHRPDSGSQSELWYTSAYPESAWIADWVMLARRYAANPDVIGADLHNEPHGNACWGCGDASRDWAAAATRGGDAVLRADPHLLILVEGVEHPANEPSTWWGGGLSDAAAHPIALTVPHQLVYSPHDYPASIYQQAWFSEADYPSNLAGVWNRNFGFLQTENVAPVMLGEFGTKLETTSDRQWLTKIVGYLKSNRMSFAYWSFNPNSGDTGGLVKDDWVTPQAAKLAALSPLLGSGSALPPIAVPNPPPSGSAPTKPAPGAPISPRPTVGRAAANWTLQSAWNAGYVANFVVTAKNAVSGWSISWSDPGASSIANAWGMACSVSDARIHCHGVEWGASIAAGSSVHVGLQVNGDGAAPVNPGITLG